MTTDKQWKVAFYGDDFTGSTDVMEVLSLYGMPSILFLGPPTESEISSLGQKYECLGIAGISRSMSTENMDEELVPAFAALKRLQPELLHYKICSTFDSSPETGSIGHAIDTGFGMLGCRSVPLIVGAPRLKRFVAFGQLFARANGVTYRLDRHPTMSRHPITPMTESDIGRHLSLQTEKSCGLVSVLELESSEQSLDAAYQDQNEQHEVVLFDTINSEHLYQVGRLLWQGRDKGQGFVVGSSGVEYALGAYFERTGLSTPRDDFRSVGEKEPVLVMCGSASPATEGQIRYAMDCGFAGHQLDIETLVGSERRLEAAEALAVRLSEQLESGKNLVVYATLGPEDPKIIERKALEKRLGVDSLGTEIATMQARLLKRILELSPSVKRACVAGGDTSGHCAKALGIKALEMAATIAPGAPLCRAIAAGRFDGIEIAFKGGQNGLPNYFECIRRGCAFED